MFEKRSAGLLGRMALGAGAGGLLDSWLGDRPGAGAATGAIAGAFMGRGGAAAAQKATRAARASQAAKATPPPIPQRVMGQVTERPSEFFTPNIRLGPERNPVLESFYRDVNQAGLKTSQSLPYVHGRQFALITVGLY